MVVKKGCIQKTSIYRFPPSIRSVRGYNYMYVVCFVNMNENVLLTKTLLPTHVHGISLTSIDDVINENHTFLHLFKLERTRFRVRMELN